MHVLRTLLPLLLPCVAGVHVAFIAPPASHYVPMLPIAHGLLEEGHQVTFLGYPETTSKIAKLVPRADMAPLAGSNTFNKDAIKVIQTIPYGASQFFTNFAILMINSILGGPMALSAKVVLQEIKPDVLCVSYVYPIHFALAETLGIPVIGIGWASPMFLTTQLDLPWSTEPNIGTIHTRSELFKNPATLIENCLVRIAGFFFLRIGSMVNSVYRFRIGHPDPLEPWEFDSVLQHPMIVMTLPELTSGMPTLVSPYTFMVGILDHPGLGGSSIAKSDDAERIMAWLDSKQAEGKDVFYFAFGSEVMVDDKMAQFLAETFRDSGLTVLWANKVKPNVALPDCVLYTKFAPQRAVLQHPAVVGFLSHGGANSVNEALMTGTPMVIIPFFADQMAVGAAQQELGVARLVRKDAWDGAALVAALREVAAEPIRGRAEEVRRLNDERKDMGRAVQVITNQATGKFRLHIPRAPGLLRFIPLVLTLLLASACCNACCCCRFSLQRPCCCRPKAAAQLKKTQKRE